MKARIAKKIARSSTVRHYTPGQRSRALVVLSARLYRGCPRWLDDATGPRAGERIERTKRIARRILARKATR